MIYAIWECDCHGSYDSYAFKGFFTNQRVATKTYEKFKPQFNKSNPDGWILSLGIYNGEVGLDINCVRSFTVLKSTEDGD